MFYEELKIELQELFNEQKYDEVLKIINTEMAMPYIPNDFEDYLLDLKKRVLEFLENGTKENILSLQKIKEILLKSNSQNILEQNLMIKSLQKINIRKVLNEVKEFLINKNIIPENKTLILFILKEQQVDEKISVFKDNKEIEIDVLKLDLELFNTTVAEISSKIDNILGSYNPSLAEICFSISLTYFLSIYPEKILDLNSYVVACIISGFKSLGIDQDPNILKNIVFNQDELKKYLTKIQNFQGFKEQEND